MLPTLRALFDAPSTSPLAEVKVTNVADLLIELTDVRHPMAAKQMPNASIVVKVSHYCRKNHDFVAVYRRANYCRYVWVFGYQELCRMIIPYLAE